MSKYLLTDKTTTIKDDVYRIYKRSDRDGFTYVYPVTLMQHEITPADIKIISVLPSVGKTYWAINQLTNGAIDKNYIYLFMSPSINLLNEVYSSLVESFTNTDLKISKIKKIHGFTDTEVSINLTTIFLNELKVAKLGTVFLITHALYMQIADLPRKDEIFAIFDEAQSFGITAEEFSPSPKDLSFLKKHLFLEPIRHRTAPLKLTSDFKPKDIEIYFKVHGKKSDIEEFKKSNVNKNAIEYPEFLEKTMHKKLDVYMIKKQRSEGYSFFSFSSPKHTFEGFAEIYLMGAFFGLSELYHILDKHHNLQSQNKLLSDRLSQVRRRYNSLQITPITDKLFYNGKEHEYLSKSMLKNGIIYNGDCSLSEIRKDFTQTYKDFETYLKGYKRYKILKILKAYLFKKSVGKDLEKDKLLETERTRKKLAALIKPLRKKYIEYLKVPVEVLLEKATDDFEKDYEALAVVNKINLKLHSNKIKPKNFITPSVHGLNKYQRMNAMVFLAALRPKPTVINFYDHFISDYQWHLNLLGANIVQALCRLNIRDIESDKPTYLYVPTEDTAKLLQTVLHKVLDYASPERLPALINETKILSIENLIIFDRKKRKIKDHLLLKNTKGEVIGKTTTENILRENDKYKKLMSELNSLNRKLKTYENSSKNHRGAKDYKILALKKIEISDKVRVLRGKLKEKKNI